VVGAIEETVVVTGQVPCDADRTTATRLTRDTIDQLPTSRATCDCRHDAIRRHSREHAGCRRQQG
jgi:hypothetical protein